VSFPTISDTDYEFIVDLPESPSGGPAEYSIGHTPEFPLNTLVWANELRAVEVYTNPLKVPEEFKSGSMCGAIVVWTDVTRR